jgi:cyclopropane-fatty-acyl-phospholipid synthase
MAASKSETIVRELLDLAEIEINGSNPWDIQVHDPRLYDRVLQHATLGLGEAYMDGWWDCEAVDQFIDRALCASLEQKVRRNWRLAWHVLRSRLLNLQSPTMAFEVGEEHYDLGNDQPGMRVLELGCGWGSFAKYAAEVHGAEVLGVTVSKEQVALGMELCEGLPVELRLQDYREVEGTYDAVISIGVMEHVGYKNYRTYMQVADRCLKEGGIAFVHTIGGNKSSTTGEPWTDKYIFPNGMLPSIAQLGAAMEGLFIIEDWHNFGPHYDKTLMAWHANFEAAWPDLKASYGERFYRMWRYYLLSCAGGFRARNNQLWQIVMTRPGSPQPECRYS